MRNNPPFIIWILLIAAFLRILGIWHGYPFSFYPDEVHFVKRALSFGSFDFNPHWFHKPAFYMYLLFFEYSVYFLIGKCVNLWGSVSDFAVSYVLNPGPFYIIGRLSTTLFGLFSLFMVYLTGKKFFSKTSGTIGALLLALSCAHVASCQDVKADIPASFFAILSMYFLLSSFSSSQKNTLLLSAAAAGLGAATKVYPIVMLIPLFLAILLLGKGNSEPLKKKLMTIIGWSTLAFATFWLSYFLGSPFSFLDPLGRESVFGHALYTFQKILLLFKGHEPAIMDAGRKSPSAFITASLDPLNAGKEYLSQ